MSCPEMGQAYSAMTSDMGQKLSGYYQSLQMRFGDPRVYAMQRQEMQRQEAAVVHSKAQKTSDLLKEAYDKKVQKHRETHRERLSKPRGRRAVAVSPESTAPNH
jgi:hypothetical protein